MTMMFRQLNWNYEELYTESGSVCSFVPATLPQHRLDSEDNIKGQRGRSR